MLKAELKDGKLVLTIDADTTKPRESASGKTLVVASSRGNVQTSLQIKGSNVTVGINAYIPNPEYVAPPK